MQQLKNFSFLPNRRDIELSLAVGIIHFVDGCSFSTWLYWRLVGKSGISVVFIHIPHTSESPVAGTEQSMETVTISVLYVGWRSS